MVSREASHSQLHRYVSPLPFYQLVNVTSLNAGVLGEGQDTILSFSSVCSVDVGYKVVVAVWA